MVYRAGRQRRARSRKAPKATRRVGLVLPPKGMASDRVNSERSTAIYIDWMLAFSARFLGCKEEAYQHMHLAFVNGDGLSRLVSLWFIPAGLRSSNPTRSSKLLFLRETGRTLERWETRPKNCNRKKPAITFFSARSLKLEIRNLCVPIRRAAIPAARWWFERVQSFKDHI
jgi:hypothetical protein